MSATPTSLRLALRELRRHLSTRMGAITLLALVTVPTIYGGLYLYANHDPYGALDRVPAAVVVADTGATAADGSRLEAGSKVADQLLERGDFDWHRVDPAEARAGVAEGTYDFALVIPEDFSAALSSTAGTDPHQARLRMVTNDANSYLSTTIANTVTSRVREAIASEVSQEATSRFLLGFADVHDGLTTAADGAEQLRDGLRTAHRGAGRLADGATDVATGAEELSAGAGELSTGLGTLSDAVAPLPGQARQLARGADQVADGNETLAATGRDVADVVHRVARDHAARRAELVTAMEEAGLDEASQQDVLRAFDRWGDQVDAADTRVSGVSGQLDRLATGARRVADGNRDLADATPALVSGIDSAHDGAQAVARGGDRLSTGADELSDGAGDLDEGLGDLSAGAGHLTRGLRGALDEVPATDSALRAQIAETVADPVEVRSSSQAQARSYGDGLAPFFLALATWIGAYVLFIVLKPRLAGRDAERVHGWRAALGGWLPAALLGAAQASVLVLVVAFGVGISSVDLLATWGFLVLLSVVFVAVVHAFTLVLGQPGQFLALVLMVLQLVTAGGTFPWQTIPEPLHWLHHVLPMSYAVDGLRLLMYGAPSTRLATDVAVLLAWGGAALAVSLLVGTRQERRARAALGDA
ncbi:MAG: YhgE/Pip family protein [Nocardioides sp.]|uniref:YhgE/Pip family protein n=1 Tax=Nocardioides sp. TaxID=35761 RepID=UPI003EFED0E1